MSAKRVITKRQIMIAMAAIETSLAALDIWIMWREHRGA